MNTGGDLDLEMRLMNSKLRKINKEFSKNKHQVKSILKSSKPVRKQRKEKWTVAFDLKNIDYID